MEFKVDANDKVNITSLLLVLGSLGNSDQRINVLGELRRHDRLTTP